jgi:hypothetical protein
MFRVLSLVAARLVSSKKGNEMTSHQTRRSTQLAAAIALAVGTTEATTATTITVTDGGDAGTASTCTLRQAIAAANPGSTPPPAASTCSAGDTSQNTIVFAPSLISSTITLSPGQGLSVASGTPPLTIVGSAQTISAGFTSGVLAVYNTTFDASGLNVTDGNQSGLFAKSVTNLTLSNCDISNNSQYNAGGGIRLLDTAAAYISNCVIHNNHLNASTVPSFGGGVYAAGGKVSFFHSTIASNSAAFGAGIYSSGTLMLVDSTVTGNNATSSGGGVDVRFGKSYITNTTIYKNSAGGAAFFITNYNGAGGAVYRESTPAMLVNSTIVGNTSSRTGAIFEYSFSPPAIPMTLYNSIVANNSGGDCGNAPPALNNVASSLISDSTTACGVVNGTNGNIVGTDPQLNALASNGGPTQTMALAPTSPAVGAGSVALATFNRVPLNYDQRGFGFPRTVGHLIDMGAFQTLDSRIFAGNFDPAPPEP